MYAYIISIDPDRYDRTARELARVGVRGILFQGVDGKRDRQSPQVTPFCAQFCTDKMIGTGLAHIRLAEHIARTGHDSKSQHTLVVEDDVWNPVPDLVTRIQEVVRNAQSEWDVITLFCQGVCASPRFLSGSTAAYLISLGGARKLSKKRLSYHIDMQWSSGLNIYLGPTLFETCDPRQPPILFRQSWLFWTKQHLIRVGAWDVTVGHLVVGLIVLLGVVMIIIESHSRSNRPKRRISYIC